MNVMRLQIYAAQQPPGRNRCSDYQRQRQSGFPILYAVMQQIKHPHRDRCNLRRLYQKVAL